MAVGLSQIGIVKTYPQVRRQLVQGLLPCLGQLFFASMGRIVKQADICLSHLSMQHRREAVYGNVKYGVSTGNGFGYGTEKTVAKGMIKSVEQSQLLLWRQVPGIYREQTAPV